MSRINISCIISRIEVTQNGYPKTEERTSLRHSEKEKNIQDNL